LPATALEPSGWFSTSETASLRVLLPLSGQLHKSNIKNLLVPGLVVSTAQESALMHENFWKDKYSADVPFEINPDMFPNIQAVMHQSCTRYADKPAFTCLG